MFGGKGAVMTSTLNDVNSKSEKNLDVPAEQAVTIELVQMAATLSQKHVSARSRHPDMGHIMEREPQAIHLDQVRRTDSRATQKTSTTNYRRRTLLARLPEPQGPRLGPATGDDPPRPLAPGPTLGAGGAAHGDGRGSAASAARPQSPIRDSHRPAPPTQATPPVGVSHANRSTAR